MSTVHYGPGSLVPFLALLVRGDVASLCGQYELRKAVLERDPAGIREWLAGSCRLKLAMAYYRANAMAWNRAYAHRLQAGEKRAVAHAFTDAEMVAVARMAGNPATDWREIAGQVSPLRYNLDDSATKGALEFCTMVAESAIQFYRGDR